MVFPISNFGNFTSKTQQLQRINSPGGEIQLFSSTRQEVKPLTIEKNVPTDDTPKTGLPEGKNYAEKLEEMIKHCNYSEIRSDLEFPIKRYLGEDGTKYDLTRNSDGGISHCMILNPDNSHITEVFFNSSGNADLIRLYNIESNLIMTNNFKADGTIKSRYVSGVTHNDNGGINETVLFDCTDNNTAAKAYKDLFNF